MSQFLLKSLKLARESLKINKNSTNISQVLKGTSGRKKSLAQMKEREKMQKNEPLPTSMRQMVLEIFHFKVRNLSNLDVTIL